MLDVISKKKNNKWKCVVKKEKIELSLEKLDKKKCKENRNISKEK
jgi:hypothetical protein